MYVLKDEIKKAILQSDLICLKIAGDVGVRAGTVALNVRRDAPVITQQYWLESIRKALALNQDEVITEFQESIKEKYLHE